MTMHLLRIEGVNHAHCIDDTENLPTRRGGSLMLLHAMPYLHEKFADTLAPVSTGASVGLFKVMNPACMSGIADEVHNLLASHPTFRHATFMVDQVSDGGSFSACEYRAVNANRWRQMGSLSFSVAGMTSGEKPPHGVCAFDTVRPARHTHTIQDETHHISTSVRDRRRVGVEQKRAFYDQEISELGTLRQSNPGDDYTHEFAELSDRPGHLLDGKLAVFYADGNDFGRHARKARDTDALRDWDRAVKCYRRWFLDTLIAHAQGPQGSAWVTMDGQQRLRIETLLWGGDEFMIVVPAWCGFELASMFLAASQAMDYPPGSGHRLTHACGLVFCSHKTPISHIADLAKRLAELGKRDQDSKAHDTLNWLVLESLDHAGEDLDRYLEQRFPDTDRVTWPDLELRREALAVLCSTPQSLKNELPRSAIVRAARMLAAGASTEHALLKASYAQIDDARKGRHEAPWDALWKALHPAGPAAIWATTPAAADLPAWIKLLETWDYVIADTSSMSQGDQA